MARSRSAAAIFLYWRNPLFDFLFFGRLVFFRIFDGLMLGGSGAGLVIPRCLVGIDERDFGISALRTLERAHVIAALIGRFDERQKHGLAADRATSRRNWRRSTRIKTTRLRHGTVTQGDKGAAVASSAAPQRGRG
jgi:hypothetical protein